MPSQQGALAYDEATEASTTSGPPAKKGKDWERIFEDPQGGLIPLLQRANSGETIVRIMQVLVEQLFTRETDHEAREEYRAAIRRLAEEQTSRDVVLDRAIAYLRDMKAERIRRAAAADRMDTRNARKTNVKTERPRDAEDVFVDAFLNRFHRFFDIACDGVTLPLWGSLPFVLSHAFADRLIAIVDADMMPAVLARTRHMIARIQADSPNDVESAINAVFSGHKTRRQLAEIWSDVWQEKTTTVRVPDAPDDGSRGLIGKLFGRKDDRPKWMREPTYEEWEAEVDEINARNTDALRIWGAITESSDDFYAPKDDDWEFLKRIPLRGHDSLQSQITAITQIAVQGSSNTAFTAYQRNRDVDLALLISCYRYPDTFLGEDGFLADVMRGYAEKNRKRRFPLTYRYLIRPSS